MEFDDGSVQLEWTFPENPPIHITCCENYYELSPGETVKCDGCGVTHSIERAPVDKGMTLE